MARHLGRSRVCGTWAGVGSSLYRRPGKAWPSREPAGCRPRCTLRATRARDVRPCWSPPETHNWSTDQRPNQLTVSSVVATAGHVRGLRRARCAWPGPATATAAPCPQPVEKTLIHRVRAAVWEPASRTAVEPTRTAGPIAICSGCLRDRPYQSDRRVTRLVRWAWAGL